MSDLKKGPKYGMVVDLYYGGLESLDRAPEIKYHTFSSLEAGYLEDSIL